MKKFGTKQIVPLALAALSATFLVTGLSKFGFWDSTKGPTPAFVPSIICVILLALSVAQLATSFKEAPAVFHRDEFKIILAILLLVAGIYVIGMFPAMIVFMLVWLGVVEKSPWKSTILVTAATMALLYGVFAVWLHVRFPEGLIMEMLF